MAKNANTPAVSIGDFKGSPIAFPGLDALFASFDDQEFKRRSTRKRFHRINQVLLQLIQEAPTESFLLPAVIDYISRINAKRILHEPYHMGLFEFWLNQFSELDEQKNYEVRAKIMGKNVPRDDYQLFFPIGMEKVFSGTHFVAAHLSPDVDTMVASFWGWIDAFAARVGTARHLWSLPGGPPDSPVTQAFTQFFGKDLFPNIAYLNNALTLSAIDLVSQKGVVKKLGSASLSTLDLSGARAVILVDENGHFLGDWHTADIEPIRKIIIRFKSCLRWFENNLHVQLITLFTKKDLRVNDIPPFLASVFDVVIQDCEPVKEFTERQKKDLDDFYRKVLEMPKGLQSTFAELNQALKKLSIYDLSQFQTEVEALRQSDLFDRSGLLKEDRPAIFHRIEKIIHQLDTAIQHIRDYAEQLDVALRIKSRVFGVPSQFVTMHSSVDDLRIKIGKKEYVTVVIMEEEDKPFPVGVVWGSTLQKPILGTISFRDFCNQEEVKMASYLTPISVVDHHKTSLKTSSPPLALIGDAQSCNVIVAEQEFQINDRYSLGGLTPAENEQEFKALSQAPRTLTNTRLLQRLSKQRLAAEARHGHYIHPDREQAEYLCFLHAILDDTDLLTKVSKRDVECVVELLNRLKSLLMKRPCEVINLDDIARDKDFAKAAAKRILRNSEMYSLYRKVFESKEQEIEHSLKESQAEHYNRLFVDTKEQNGCCRIGQTKLFSRNIPVFRKNVDKMMKYWVEQAQEVYESHPEIDLHIHMISTVASAAEVYEDKVGHYSHQDQLWFWVPPTQKAYDHLTSFLTAFQAAHQFGTQSKIEFLSEASEDMQQIFIQNLPDVPHEKKKGNLPIAILHFNAGMLNSRKAMVTPYLPRAIS